MIVNYHDGDRVLIHKEFQKLQRDTDTNYGVVFIVYKDLGIAAERSSTLSNGMRPKRFDAVLSVTTIAIRIATATRPAIFNLQ